ncbi:MAG: transposase [Desulfonatronovibrio sp.]
MSYSLQFKEKVVKMVFTGSVSKARIARDMGVPATTMHYWLKQAKDTGDTIMTKQEKRPQDWSSKEKIEALIDAAKLPEQELGAWCRKKGLHTHHLDQWKNEFSQEQTKDNDVNIRQLKKELKGLKKEINRKDKALAETTALLVLKKKVDAIWGDKEDD